MTNIISSMGKTNYANDTLKKTLISIPSRLDYSDHSRETSNYVFYKDNEYNGLIVLSSDRVTYTEDATDTLGTQTTINRLPACRVVV